MCQIFIALILHVWLLWKWLRHWALNLLNGTIVIFSNIRLWIFILNFLAYFGRIVPAQVIFTLPGRRRVSTGSFRNIFEGNLFIRWFLWIRLGNVILHWLIFVVGWKNTLGLSLRVIKFVVGPINRRCFLWDYRLIWYNDVILISLDRIHGGLFLDPFLGWVAPLLKPRRSERTSYRLFRIKFLNIIFVFLMYFHLVACGIFGRIGA